MKRSSRLGLRLFVGALLVFSVVSFRICIGEQPVLEPNEAVAYYRPKVTHVAVIGWINENPEKAKPEPWKAVWRGARITLRQGNSVLKQAAILRPEVPPFCVLLICNAGVCDDRHVFFFDFEAINPESTRPLTVTIEFRDGRTRTLSVAKW